MSFYDGCHPVQIMNKANATMRKHWDEVNKDQREHMMNLKDYYGVLFNKGCVPCEKTKDCELLNNARQCKQEGFIHGAISNLVSCKELTVRVLGERKWKFYKNGV